MEPVKLKRRQDDDLAFDLSLESKFVGGIEFGNTGIALATHVKFNSEDNTVIRYYAGPRLRNLKGKYVLLDIPHAAVGTFQTVDVKHNLKSVPQGVILLQQTGYSRSAYPYSLTSELLGMICVSDSDLYWNKDWLRLKFVKILGSANPSRVLVAVI